MRTLLSAPPNSFLPSPPPLAAGPDTPLDEDFLRCVLMPVSTSRLQSRVQHAIDMSCRHQKLAAAQAHMQELETRVSELQQQVTTPHPQIKTGP